MFACYHDIMSKLERPLWFDESAVPRYCEFHPRYLANIYVDEAALLHVGCQVCEIPFIVAMSGQYPVLTTGIGDNTISYGDPPNVGCNNASMSSAALQVLQYWRRPLLTNWQRHPEHEVVIRPSWMSAEERQRRRGSKEPPNSDCG